MTDEPKLTAADLIDDLRRCEKLAAELNALVQRITTEAEASSPIVPLEQEKTSGVIRVSDPLPCDLQTVTAAELLPLLRDMVHVLSMRHRTYLGRETGKQGDLETLLNAAIARLESEASQWRPIPIVNVKARKLESEAPNAD